jgi:hypothetical protein
MTGEASANLIGVIARSDSDPRVKPLKSAHDDGGCRVAIAPRNDKLKRAATAEVMMRTAEGLRHPVFCMGKFCHGRQLVNRYISSRSLEGFRCQTILSALARLEAGQASMQADRASLHTGFQTLRTDMLAELGQTRGAIMGRVAELQASVTAIRDDITVNMGRVDAVRQANDNTRADLVQMREQMSVMWKQIKTLEARVRGITGDP